MRVKHYFCFFFPQLTLYLGKRDYVDHVESVDAVGKNLHYNTKTDKKF